MNKLLLFSLPLFISGLHASFASDSGGWKPGYEKGNNGTSAAKVYYAQDGTCGVRDGNVYVKPSMEFMAHEKEDKKDAMPAAGGKVCLKNIRNAEFGPMCGDPFYLNVKHCTLVSAFNNKKLEEVDFGQDSLKDTLLAFVDGCAACNKQASSSDLTLELHLEWTMPAGSVFTKCGEEVKEAGSIEKGKIKFFPANNARMFPAQPHHSANGSGASFVLHGIFYHRICKGLFSADDVETAFKDIKLVVKHNCGGNEASFEVKMPDLVNKDYNKKFHIAEMRGLKLDLETGEALLYNRCPGSFKYEPDLKWGNWKMITREECHKP